MAYDDNIRIRVGNGSDRVIRGGSWHNDDWNCRGAYRNWNHPANRDNDLGFRLVSSLFRQEPVVHG